MQKHRKLSLLLAVIMLISTFSFGVYADNTHTIKAGEVLWKIAKMYGLDYKLLAEYNKIVNPDRIIAGNELKIPAATPAEPVAPAKANLTILHTNDMHGFFVEGKYEGMGAAKMLGYVNEVRTANPNTLLIDAGDALQGSNLVTLSKGESAVRVMNAMDYDAMAVGNHEFDYAAAQLKKLQGMLEFPMLAANVKKTDGSLYLDDYKIFVKDGVKIGVFGISTPETKYKSHPDNTVGVDFTDIYATATEMVKTLKAQGANVIICAAHLGDEGEYTSQSLVEKVAGIDVVLDGHSHSKYEQGKVVNNTLIASTGYYTMNVGHIDLVVENGKVTSKVAKLYTKDEAAKTGKADPEMTEIVASIANANKIITEEVVAESPVELIGVRADVRTDDTNLGNLLAEALLYSTKADVALTNGGGIRSSINAGPVTKGEVLTVLPYGNYVRVIEVTGADLVAAIENGVSTYPAENGGFPHIAGMTVKFDAKKPAGSRVVELKVNGVLVDTAKTYKLATNDFTAAGGDKYTMFTGKKVVGELAAMDQVLIDYMNKVGFGKAVEDNRIQDINTLVSFILKWIAA